MEYGSYDYNITQISLQRESFNFKSIWVTTCHLSARFQDTKRSNLLPSYNFSRVGCYSISSCNFPQKGWEEVLRERGLFTLNALGFSMWTIELITSSITVTALLFLLFSGDSLDNEGNSNQQCGAGPYTMTSSQEKSFHCTPGMRGRYVNIRTTGNNKKLEICEVLVNPNPTGRQWTNLK